MAKLLDSSWIPGSFDRKTLAGSLLQQKLRYRGLFVARTKTRCLFTDDSVRGMPGAEDYQSLLSSLLMESDLMENGTNEDIYRFVHGKRLEIFGEAAFRKQWQVPVGSAHTVDGLDQRDLLNKHFCREAVLYYISDPAFLPDLLEDVKRSAGKQLYCLVSGDPDGILPGAEDLQAYLGDAVTYLPVPGCLGCMDLSAVPEDNRLSALTEADQVLFMGYGEDALLCCRNLTVPAFVKVTPESIPVRAVTGLFTEDKTCLIYIPAHFDIIPNVPCTERTRLTYYHLTALCRKYGEGVYRESWEALAMKEPGLFLNIYDDHLPPVGDPDFRWDGKNFDLCREEYLLKKYSDLPGISYLHTCLSKETWEPVPTGWGTAEKRNQVMIDGVLVSPEKKVTVYPGGSGACSPRKTFFRREETSPMFLSNFAFFFTEKLERIYNLLREGAPKEHLAGNVGYVDYRRYTDEAGNRHETFPLYGKSCLAAKKSGGYTAFSLRLGGGSVHIGNTELRWQSRDVNPKVPGEIAVYTPMLSDKDTGASEDYLLPVGEGRLNIIVIGENATCIREGSVYLPCIGVVLSLDGTAAEGFRKQLTAPDGQGYYPASLPVQTVLSAPEGWTDADWDDLAWVYGGGLGLIGAEGAMTKENYMQLLGKEGWLTPLSVQTQESKLHTLAVHPRTAVGVTKKGELFILVFSGRTKVSDGADYAEMCICARKLIPDIEVMINWDGGGSSFLGVLEGNVLTELSYTAPSDDSLTGMVRPVNSIITIGE